MVSISTADIPLGYMVRNDLWYETIRGHCIARTVSRLGLQMAAAASKYQNTDGAERSAIRY